MGQYYEPYISDPRISILVPKDSYLVCIAYPVHCFKFVGLKKYWKIQYWDCNKYLILKLDLKYSHCRIFNNLYVKSGRPTSQIWEFVMTRVTCKFQKLYVNFWKLKAIFWYQYWSHVSWPTLQYFRFYLAIVYLQIPKVNISESYLSKFIRS